MRFGMALGWLLIATGACGQVLPLPPRPADAFPGSVVGKAVTDLPLAERGAGFRSAKTTTFGYPHSILPSSLEWPRVRLRVKSPAKK